MTEHPRTPIPGAPAADLARLDRLWGCGDLDAVFAGGDLAPTPWPRAPKGVLVRDELRPAVEALVARPAQLVEMDPRTLWANQPSVVAHHARHYTTGEWERTGRTSSDPDSSLNRFPAVAVDRGGRRVIVAGHHRSLVALVEGRPVLARLDDCRPDAPVADPAVAVTPTLFLGDASTLADVEFDDVGAAVELVTAGRRIRTTDPKVAVAVLTALGLDDHEITDRLARAGVSRVG